jgi:hypothetical protein
MWIGRDVNTPGSTTTLLNGSIDEVRIWNRSLSDLEVTWLYNLTNGTTYPFTSSAYNSLVLTTPLDNTKSSTASQTFIMNATSPVGLKSISLWSDFTGTWQLNDTKANPIAHYKLNTANFSIKDQTNVSDGMSLYNGTLVGKIFNNGVTSGGVAIEDSAMKFDGVDDYVTTSFSEDKNQFTTSQWIKTNNALSHQGIWRTTTSAGNRHALRISLSGVLVYDISDGSGTSSLIGTTILNSDTWYYVTTEFYGNGTAKIYLNGNLEVSRDDLVQTSVDIVTTVIGSAYRYNGNPLYYFNGSLDDVQIYNRSLSSTEILAQYNLGRGKYAISSDGLVAQYSGRDYNGSSSAPSLIYDTNHLTNGKVNQAMGFDGVNDYVTLTPFDELKIDRNFTVSFWAKRNSIQSLQTGFTQNNGSSSRFTVQWSPSSWRMSYYDGTSHYGLSYD